MSGCRWRALFCGLMGQRGATVQSRNDRLDGILNGIDMDDWNPETGASRAAGEGWGAGSCRKSR